jgi:DNA processing protein
MSRAACADCLRRSALVGFLSARLADVLGGYDRRLSGVLALGERELIAAVGGSSAERARELVDRFDPQAAAAAVARVELGAVCRHDDRYPGSLLDLEDPPPVLYHSGGAERLARLLSAPVVTVVGTRTPSRMALEVARDLGRGLAAAGVTVVSGLALGIDAAVHRGALEAGGALVAVLPGGADVVYPRAHRGLYDSVRASGAVVAELPPGGRPRRWSFPARNRIMAGLAGLTIVVEAAEESGSLITAEFAGDLGRDVGAVPGPVCSRVAAGSNALLREGAAVIRSAGDALDELLGVGVSRRFAASRSPDRRRAGVEVAPLALTAPASPPGADDRGHDPTTGLDPPLRRVLDLVEQGDGPAAIARAEGLTPGRVRATLGRLEALGLVRRAGLAGYVRATTGPARAPHILAGDTSTGHPQ